MDTTRTTISRALASPDLERAVAAIAARQGYGTVEVSMTDPICDYDFTPVAMVIGDPDNQDKGKYGRFHFVRCGDGAELKPCYGAPSKVLGFPAEDAS